LLEKTIIEILALVVFLFLIAVIVFDRLFSKSFQFDPLIDPEESKAKI
jgi:hypothetical protein